MILKATPTGRKWGNKVNPVEKDLIVHGCRVRVEEYDIWDGPITADDRGQYFRAVFLKTKERTQTYADRPHTPGDEA